MCRGRATPPSRLQNEYSSNSDPDLIINAVFVTRFLSQSDFRPRCLLSTVSRVSRNRVRLSAKFIARSYPFSTNETLDMDLEKKTKIETKNIEKRGWLTRDEGKERKGKRSVVIEPSGLWPPSPRGAFVQPRGIITRTVHFVFSYATRCRSRNEEKKRTNLLRQVCTKDIWSARNDWAFSLSLDFFSFYFLPLLTPIQTLISSSRFINRIVGVDRGDSGSE